MNTLPEIPSIPGAPGGTIHWGSPTSTNKKDTYTVHNENNGLEWKVLSFKDRLAGIADEKFHWCNIVTANGIKFEVFCRYGDCKCFIRHQKLTTATFHDWVRNAPFLNLNIEYNGAKAEANRIILNLIKK